VRPEEKPFEIPWCRKMDVRLLGCLLDLSGSGHSSKTRFCENGSEYSDYNSDGNVFTS
jgi:hypothetical protein